LSRQRWISKFEIAHERWVYVPSNETREIGNRLKSDLEMRWIPPPYYFHLRNGGHVLAIKQHLNNTFFTRLDISDFFGSISKNRVARCLKRFYEYEEAHDFAVESTVVNTSKSEYKTMLPFGFVQSPILASICFSQSRLGKLLDRIHIGNTFKVSVYVDDLIISCNDSDELKELQEEINSAAEKSLFILNMDKSEIVQEKITAFNIELEYQTLKVTVPRMHEFSIQYMRGSEACQEGILRYLDSIDESESRRLLEGDF
jgi:hypothetical protein